MSFPRYEKYKDSEVEWLGEIPTQWDTRRIKILFEIRKRIAGELGPDVLSITQKGIKIKDLESNDGQVSMDYSKYQLVEPGYFAMNHMDLLTGYIDVSKVAGVTSPDYRVFSVRNHSICHDRYFLYLFQNAYKQNIFYAFGQGSSQLGRWRLPTEQFNDFILPFPYVEEQSTIANFLDRETAKIDALVEQQRQLIELLKEKRQAVISHAVTKGLNANIPMKDSGIEWLGKVPTHWAVGAIKYFVQSKAGAIKTGPFGSHLTSADMKSGEIKVYNQRSVIDADFSSGDNFISEEKFRQLLSFETFPGDLLVTTRGTIGKTAIVPEDAERGILHPCLLRIQTEKSKLSAQFLKALIQESALVRTQLSYMSNATTIEVIYSETMASVIIPVPPIDEQEAILEFLHNEANELNELIAEGHHAIDLLQERRTALISAAVTGKIDVRGDITVSSVVEKSYSTGFARQLLAAEILHHYHNHPTTGRVKLQKLIHLCEYVAEIDEVNGNYLRKAAGPFDNKVMFGIASGLSKQKWFSEVKDGNRTIYRPLEKAGEHKKYLARWESKMPKIHEVLGLLGKADTQQCEIVSTLYAAWNDFLIEGRVPSDEEIIHEASDPVRWHENKAKIPSDKWPKALKWMRDHELVPKGYGSHTRHDDVAKEPA